MVRIYLFNPQEISKIRYGSNGQRSISKEKLQQVFKAIDMDDSGSIEFREFIAAVVNWQQLRINDTRKLHKCALEMFQSIDMDGNGFVDPEDLKLVSATN